MSIEYCQRCQLYYDTDYQLPEEHKESQHDQGRYFASPTLGDMGNDMDFIDDIKEAI